MKKFMEPLETKIKLKNVTLLGTRRVEIRTLTNREQPLDHTVANRLHCAICEVRCIHG